MMLPILRRCGLLLAILLLNTVYPVQADPIVSANNTSALAQQSHVDQQAINVLIKKYARSVNLLDKELADQIWLNSVDTTFIHPRGHEKTWAGIWQHFYLDTMGLFKQRDLQVRDVQIFVYGNTAYAEFYWGFDAVFKKDNTPLHTDGRENQLLVRIGDQWKIAHVHYSSLPVSGIRQGF